MPDALLAEFPPEPAAVAAVRGLLRQALHRLPTSAQDRVVDDLLTAGNELATNAVLHGRTAFTVRVLLDRARVRIEVSDGNTRVPQPCLAPTDAVSGRGLSIIDASGLRWGVVREADGKTVWVEAALDAVT